MPKISSLISDDYLLKNLDHISGNIQITPAQVVLILGISAETLKDNRMKGKPPKFVKERSSIRYRVGDVRDYLNQKVVFSNTGEAALEKMREKRSLMPT